MKLSSIEYRVNAQVMPEDVARVFDASGLTRPTDDLARIARMLQGANVIVSAWDDSRLVGKLRAVTDHCFCCYIPDIAVDAKYNGQGVGRALIEELRARLGGEVMHVLLSIPEAVEFYSAVGYERFPNAFVHRRTS